MSRARLVLVTRVVGLAALVLVLEGLCRFGVIRPMTMIAPSAMVVETVSLVGSGEITADIVQTVGEVVAACAASVLAGFGLGVLIHRRTRLRQALAPVLASWYAVPFFVFYPLLVALFGLNALPLVAIGVVLALPAMMLSTLAGLDRVPRVLRLVARVHRLSAVQEAWRITLPAAAPSLFTGLKLSFAYSFIGVIAGEFILSGRGLGFGIAYAYESFETRKMYGLMLLVLLLAVGVNGALHAWEGRLASRQVRS